MRDEITTFYLSSSLIPAALIPYDVVRGLPNIQAMKIETM
jgi:hypothetical protein